MERSKKLFYDCEIINCIPSHYERSDPNYKYCDGWRDFENMGVSVIGIYLSWMESYQIIPGTQLGEFQLLVEEAEEIIGFNSINFDDNLLKANGVTIETTYDLLCETRIAAGMPPHFVKGLTRGGYSLNALAEANLGEVKTGSGELAPKLWQDGQFKEVADYCLNDVRLLVKLYMRRSGLKDPTNGKLLKLKNSSLENSNFLA